MNDPQVHLHLVSDGSGETVRAAARAARVQFDELDVEEHLWVLVRDTAQMDKVVEAVRGHPGLVIATVIDERLRRILEEACRDTGTPMVSLLDAPIAALSQATGRRAKLRPGRRLRMDEHYFARIDAMQFTLEHDDGQAGETLERADIVLIGVSRTSKTPTCVYLANRGYKAGNMPFVPEIPLPDHVLGLERPLVVGLTVDPGRLVQVRRNRLRTLNEQRETDYVDQGRVRLEVTAARRLFAERGWPVIDVTRRSIEETAAEIIRHFEARRSGKDDGSAEDG